MTSEAIGVLRVTVTPHSLTIAVGATRQFAAVVDAAPAIANRRVTWTSSDTTVVTIDATGLVRSIGPGTASIIAASVSDPTVRDEAVVVSTNASPGKNRTPRLVIVRRASVALAR
jgi:alpha-amylase